MKNAPSGRLTVTTAIRASGILTTESVSPIVSRAEGVPSPGGKYFLNTQDTTDTTIIKVAI